MTVLERIAQQTIPVTESGCLLWSGSTDHNGYGRLFYGGKNRKASRVVYELGHGPIPEGLLVCHHCDVPSCVRLDHLFLGTRSDNTKDSWRKGRQLSQVGTINGHAKLTDEQVRWAREQHAKGVKRGQIASTLGISHNYLSDIVLRKRWAHVN